MNSVDDFLSNQELQNSDASVIINDNFGSKICEKLIDLGSIDKLYID